MTATTPTTATTRGDYYTDTRDNGIDLEGQQANGVVAVEPGGDEEERELAAEIARVGSKEMLFPRMYRGDENNLIAFIAVRDSRAVGILVLRTSVTPPAVTFVWIARGYRNKGVASELVREAAQHSGREPSGLAWEGPFTSEGAKLAQRFGYVGDVELWTLRYPDAT